MQWVLDNWILLLIGGGMIAMHLFGHGHGGHDGHGGKKDAAEPDPATPRDAPPVVRRRGGSRDT
jgi:hypothetical protein